MMATEREKKATEKHTCLLSIAIAVAAQTTMVIRRGEDYLTEYKRLDIGRWATTSSPHWIGGIDCQIEREGDEHGTVQRLSEQ